MKLRMILPAVFALVAACSSNVFDLEVGQCFDDPESFDEVVNVDVVECAEPHDNEVFHVFDLADGDYPGEDEAEAGANDGCIAAFESFVESDFATSELDIRYLYPSAESWDDGDREVVCALFDRSGEQITGSEEGSAR